MNVFYWVGWAVWRGAEQIVTETVPSGKLQYSGTLAPKLLLDKLNTYSPREYNHQFQKQDNGMAPGNMVWSLPDSLLLQVHVANYFDEYFRKNVIRCLLLKCFYITDTPLTVICSELSPSKCGIISKVGLHLPAK